MRTIVHISDLHFGRADLRVLAPLKTAIETAKPDAVVVSGDLTQRARSEEFQAAAAYLKELPGPQIVVPGNHDVPLYNVLSRWLSPLDSFRRHIDSNLQPSYSDDEVSIVGVNTARSWSFKEGRINAKQVAAACERFTALPDRVFRIVVTHHPFVTLETNSRHGVIGRAEMAMAGFSRCRVDLILSGHLHASHAALSTATYGASGRSALLVQAGTATSSRLRHEPNTFNILRIDRPTVLIERMQWAGEGGAFRKAAVEEFREMENGWTRADARSGET